MLRWAGIEFRENYIALDQPGYGKGEIAEVKRVSPSGTVPALHVNNLMIGDSLAIAEWAAEQNAGLWPSDPAIRALARSVSCEMHSSFNGLRRDLGMNIMRRCPNQQWPADTQRDLARVSEVWNTCRTLYQQDGPWLFGQRSIADAFYAPVVTRLRTYSVPVDEVCQAYMNELLNDADYLEWESECVSDVWDQSGFSVIDGLYR